MSIITKLAEDGSTRYPAASNFARVKARAAVFRARSAVRCAVSARAAAAAASDALLSVPLEPCLRSAAIVSGCAIA